ncbi:MAG: hypothetical protein SFU53_10025 [Terrimicrobiaceae bacterium]|nr:hypothetical protein [Terrimicrobiaceae bacterium]
MSDHPTVSEEQLALFQQHVELQREQVHADRERSRAEEEIELKRLSTEAEMHTKNLAHAGQVLVAHAKDRSEVRAFWSGQLRWIFGIVILLIVLTASIAGFAIWQGQSEEVFGFLRSIFTHLLTLVAGFGIDRYLVSRKKGALPESESTN